MKCTTPLTIELGTALNITNLLPTRLVPGIVFLRAARLGRCLAAERARG